MSSFFGFDPTQAPQRTHDKQAPGFGVAPDPFATFGNQQEDEDAPTFDFEDDYDDDLGKKLDEQDDAFNDDTFGATDTGTDFDFGPGRMPGTQGRQQQHVLQNYNQAYPTRQPSPPRQHSRPARTGYEAYKKPNGMPDLAPNASIWGTETARSQSIQPQQRSHGSMPSIATAAKRMMSLEEVEAMMRSQSKKPSSSVTHAPVPHAVASGNQLTSGPSEIPSQRPPSPNNNTPPISFEHLNVRGQPASMHGTYQSASSRQPQPYLSQIPPLRAVSPEPQILLDRQTVPDLPPQTRRILQHCPTTVQTGHDRHPTDRPAPMTVRGHHQGPSLGGQPTTQPGQLSQPSEAERAEFLLNEANRAKRNHKIHLMSKDNGLMTPQDKNFITRIQLQQLVTATGGTDEAGPESMLVEDFYYQVFTQIRGAPTQDNQFAHTYLDQLAWRGGGNRRLARGGDNHMRRMEQQVQRAVDAAKARPKNRQLVVEGSLGKISFSNAKTPKPLLNLKRQENSDAKSMTDTTRGRQQDPVAGFVAVLRDIERVYCSLMKMEDHERRMPPPPREESLADVIQEYMEWRQQAQRLNATLWKDLKVSEPIVPNSLISHPFIAILSHSKGKKLIPRVFRQIDDQQRLTILTIIVVQLDMLDVIRYAQPASNGSSISLLIRAEIALFAQAVEPSLFAYITDAPFANVIGLAGLLTTRVNLVTIIATRTGINLLTRLISRAAIIQQTGHADPSESSQWTPTYNRLFDLLEPQLQNIWQSPVSGSDADDFGNWQFLAALGVGAGPEHQQRLVLAVKDRVMETVSYAKSLPQEVGKPKLDMVNLFMRAIGLDVDLLG